MSAGYVYTLPASRRSFRLTKSKFPGYRHHRGYVFTLCAANSSHRKCVSIVSIGKKPRISGHKVSTTKRRAAAKKANSCLSEGTDAFVVTGAVGLVTLVVPVAGEVSAAGIGVLAAATGVATYVVCAVRSSGGGFSSDNSAYLSSRSGSFYGGGGGGGGGGGSWRLAPDVGSPSAAR